MTDTELVKWLQARTSRKAVNDAIGMYSPTRVMAYFEVLELIAPNRRMRPIDRELRAHATKKATGR